MTPKERMIAAFNFKQQDDIVPFWELEFHLYPEMFGKDLILGNEYAKLSGKEKEYALNYNAEFMVEVAEKLGYSAIRMLPGYWEVAPGLGAYIWLPDEESRIRLVSLLKKITCGKILIIGDSGWFIGIPDGNSIMNLVDMMYEEPEELKKQAEYLLERGTEYGYKVVEAGADCLLACTDFAFNSGPFMSPEKFDEFVTPYFFKWVETFKKEGIFTMLHSDGNLMPILDRIVESGVNALQCIDPIAGMDIIALKKQLYGKLCLVGNIDCSLLQFGPVEKIEESVKNVVENCKEGGGFVLSGCNVIFKGIPAKHYQVMVDAHKKYGRLGNAKI